MSFFDLSSFPEKVLNPFSSINHLKRLPDDQAEEREQNDRDSKQTETEDNNVLSVLQRLSLSIVISKFGT